MKPSLDERNAAKIDELQPHVRWAGHAWLNECRTLNLQFRILEAYRSPERQKDLYAQGRTKPGAIVTYTLSSNHTKGLAVDVLPLNCTHFDITQVAERYGITHPLAWDPPHYEFNKVAKPHVQPLLRMSEEAERNRFIAVIKRSEGKRKSDLIRRYRNTHGSHPVLD